MNNPLALSQAAAEASDRLALIAPEQRYTYAQLHDHVDRRRDALAPSDHVHFVVAERNADTIVTLLALAEARLPAVLFHPRSSTAERAAIAYLVRRQPLLPDDTAAIIFTSGSTGRPKGVLVSTAALVASAEASAANLGWSPDDRWLCCLPLAHIGGLSIVSRCVLARRCMVLAPEGPFDSAELAELIVRERVTLLSLVPAMLSRMLTELPTWRPPYHLRAILLGGAPASPTLLERADAAGYRVVPTYGMTETCSQIYTGGQLLDNVELRVVDGRIQVRGPMLATAYLDDAGLRPIAGPDGWFDTGDSGSVEDGVLAIRGRADDCIITGGHNVHPAEVENALESSPDVATACVFGVADDTWGQLVAAAIVPSVMQGRSGLDAPLRSTDLDFDAGARERLAWLIRERLSPYKWPRRWAVVEALPTGPSGKIDRRQVAAAARSQLVPW